MAILDHRVEQLVTIKQGAVSVAHHEAIRVAVERQPHIGLVFEHGRAHGGRMGGTAFFVDVEAVRLIADRNHFCAQLAEHVRADTVGGTVRAIEHDPHATQR